MDALCGHAARKMRLANSDCSDAKGLAIVRMGWRWEVMVKSFSAHKRRGACGDAPPAGQRARQPQRPATALTEAVGHDPEMGAAADLIRRPKAG